jgi:hypothetical protein
MKLNLKKLLAIVLLGGMVISGSAMADWSEYNAYNSWGYGHSYYRHYNWYHHHHHYYNGGNDLAAGLLVGGVVGILAGSAMAHSEQPTVYENNYYAPETCYKRVVRHQYFYRDGVEYEYVQKAWRTVCN